MKIPAIFFYMLFAISSASGKEQTYIGSTPANSVVKDFLGIRISDSIDFIRWTIVIDQDSYQLHCNFGLSEPNTTGFKKGGSKLQLSGRCSKVGNYYHLRNGPKLLKLMEVNTDLVHFANADNSLLVGNGGWSFTLNSIAPLKRSTTNTRSIPFAFKDSLRFVGRTPCGVPGVVSEGKTCYKLKWLIVLHSNRQPNSSGSFTIKGTRWRQEGGITGDWKVIDKGEGRFIYQLNHRYGKGVLYFLKLDDNIIVFTDSSGKPLVGDKDYSYTLNVSE